MKLQKENLGKVAITIEKGYWDLNKDYDKLTVVQVEDKFATYVSRKPVPAGTVVTNREYWIPFSSLKEDIVLDHETFKAKYDKELADIKDQLFKIDDVLERAKHIDEKFDSIQESADHLEDLVEKQNNPGGIITADNNGQIALKQLPNGTVINQPYPFAAWPNNVTLFYKVIDSSKEQGFINYTLTIDSATTTDAGVMSAQDKTDLINILNALAHKGEAGNLAVLNDSGHIPSENLPSYIDDIVEFANKVAFPDAGEKGKIYVALNTNTAYRWSGTDYVAIPNYTEILAIVDKVQTTLGQTIGEYDMSGTKYFNKTTDITNTLKKIDTNLGDRFEENKDAVFALRNYITGEPGDNIIYPLDYSRDFTYFQTNTNYINSANTPAKADKLLDTEIKTLNDNLNSFKDTVSTDIVDTKSVKIIPNTSGSYSETGYINLKVENNKIVPQATLYVYDGSSNKDAENASKNIVTEAGLYHESFTASNRAVDIINDQLNYTAWDSIQKSTEVGSWGDVGETKLTKAPANGSGKITPHIYLNVYDGSRNVNSSSPNLVQEKGLYSTLLKYQKQLTAGQGISIAEDGTISCNCDHGIAKVVTTLPTENIDSNKIYLLPLSTGEGNNVYTEYLYINNKWEKIGEITLSTDITYPSFITVDAATSGDPITHITGDNEHYQVNIVTNNRELVNGSNSLVTEKVLTDELSSIHDTTNNLQNDINNLNTPATTAADGLMSNVDKAFIDSIADKKLLKFEEVYSVSEGMQLAFTTPQRGGADDGIGTFWEDVIVEIPNASTTANGTMSSADKVKLDAYPAYSNVSQRLLNLEQDVTDNHEAISNSTPISTFNTFKTDTNRTLDDLRQELDAKANSADLSNVLGEEVVDSTTAEEVNTLTREQLKKDLFIDLWNKVGGAYDSTTGLFSLNNLSDITYEQALDIYTDVRSIAVSSNYNSVKGRTNILVSRVDGFLGGQQNLMGFCTGNKNLESFVFNDYLCVLNLYRSFMHNAKLKVIGDGTDSNIIMAHKYVWYNGAGAETFDYLPLLEEVRIRTLVSDIMFRHSPNLSLASLQYMITNAKNTTNITVTVHPDVYAKLTDTNNTEWYAVLTTAQSKNISFATNS